MSKIERMRNLKRILFLVLVVALVFSSVGVTSFAVHTDHNHKKELTDYTDLKKENDKKDKKEKIVELKIDSIEDLLEMDTLNDGLIPTISTPFPIIHFPML